MRFLLNIDVSGFGPDPYAETARLLRAIADRLDGVKPSRKAHEYNLGDYTDRQKGWTGHYQTLLDSNGNDVGRYAFKPEGH